MPDQDDETPWHIQDALDARHVLQHRYRPLFRPAGYATLPRGLKWDYVEIPAWLRGKRDLPISVHPHGIIATDRVLTQDEIDTFELAPCP